MGIGWISIEADVGLRLKKTKFVLNKLTFLFLGCSDEMTWTTSTEEKWPHSWTLIEGLSPDANYQMKVVARYGDGPNGAKSSSPVERVRINYMKRGTLLQQMRVVFIRNYVRRLEFFFSSFLKAQNVATVVYNELTFGFMSDCCMSVPTAYQKQLARENWFLRRPSSKMHGCGLYHSYGENRATTNNVSETST